MVVIALIGGSGLMKSELFAHLSDELVDTAHGRVFLRTGRTPTGETLVFVQRHDARPTREYTQPADINYAAVALALKAKKADFVVGVCSVGSLKPSIGVGSLVVCDDFWCPSDLRRVYSDARAHLMPGLSAPVREAALECLRKAGYHPLAHGVYANAAGPRFETKAEIRMMADYCDVVGMTAAHEASACAEVGVPYAMVCMVDNFAHGVSAGAHLTVDDFHKAQAANMRVVEACVASLLRNLPGSPALAPLLQLPAAAVASSSSESTGGAAATAAAPRAVDLLVHARFVVPMVPGAESVVLDRHSLVVSGGRILEIVPTPSDASSLAAKYAPTRVITLDEHHVVMPGIVNAHTHLALNLFKGLADDMPLAQWLTEQIWPTEARCVSPEFVRVGTLAALAECIRSGVTCINDMYWYPAATADVLESTGMRGLVSMVAIEFPMGGYASCADEYLARGMEARTASLATGSGRVTWALGPHAPYTVSDATFAKIARIQGEINCPVNIHLHETAGEVACSCSGTPGPTKHMSEHKCSPLANLDRLGLLGPSLIAVHMTSLTDDEIARVAATRTNVVHCPSSNLKLASGFCPVAKLLASGVNVALGTDSASSNNSLDMFGELKLAAVLAKGVSSDATVVPAWQALRMATVNGAQALGLGTVCGSLEAGKAADFIAVRLDDVEQQPMYSVQSHLVYACNRSAVTDVWVAGTHLMSDRALLTIDERALKTEMKKWAEVVRPKATAEDKHVDAATTTMVA